MDGDEMDMRPTSLLAEIMKNQQYGPAGAGASKGGRKKKPQQEQDGELVIGAVAKKPSVATRRARDVNDRKDEDVRAGAAGGEATALTLARELTSDQGGRVTLRCSLRNKFLNIISALRTNGKTVEFCFTPWGLVTQAVNDVEGDALKHPVCTTARLHSRFFGHYECRGQVNAVLKLNSLHNTLMRLKKDWQIPYVQIEADNNQFKILGANDSNRFDGVFRYTRNVLKRHVDEFLPVSQYPYKLQCYTKRLLAYVAGYISIIDLPSNEQGLVEIRLYLDPRRLFIATSSDTGSVASIVTELTSAMSALSMAPITMKNSKRMLSDDQPEVAEESVTLSAVTNSSSEIVRPTKTRRGGTRGRGTRGRGGRIAAARLAATRTQEVADLASAAASLIQEPSQALLEERATAVAATAAAAAETQAPAEVTDEPVKLKALEEPMVEVPSVIMEEAGGSMGEYIKVTIAGRELLAALGDGGLGTYCTLHLHPDHELLLQFKVTEKTETAEVSVIDIRVPQKNPKASHALDGDDGF